MMIRGQRLIALAVPLALAGILLGCTRQEATSTSRIEEKVFRLDPAKFAVRVGFLTGQLTDLRVVQRVNEATGEVVDAPKLRATLKLKNASADQAARLLGGDVEYLNPSGQLIKLAEGRTDTSFKFYSMGSDRLDPGMETSHEIDVPFPAAGLNGKTLADVRLSMTYLPLPYREDSVTLPVALAR